MSHAIAAAADLNAPPVSKILAEFVSSHPSQGWSAEVEHEAHRTFLNWLGCAIGAAIMKALNLPWPQLMSFNQRRKRASWEEKTRSIWGAPL